MSLGIKFVKFSNYLVEYFFYEKLLKLKYLLKGMFFLFRLVLIYYWFNRNFFKR